MAIAATAVLAGAGSLVLLGFGLFGIQCLRENERRAAGMASILASLGGVAVLLALLLPDSAKVVLFVIITAAGGAGVALFLVPVGRVERAGEAPLSRVDERDIMFARRRLEEGSVQYESYYAMRPQNKVLDDQIRSLPGLLSLDARKAHALHFASAEACFVLPRALRGWVDGPVAVKPHGVEPAAITAYLKGLARYLGAQEVGIAELRPYHIYSHVGRGSGEYGDPITLDHRYAVAFTVEMSHYMMGTAPDAPEVMETAKQYSEAAQVAVQLAALIRLLGYPARAHIDGDYRVIAPLVARDAGLGEIGRMGLLMTPHLGPRVRLGVVTTNLPVIADARNFDPSVIDFCRVCRKCAENCPSRSIPFGDRQEADGALRWQMDAAGCFKYWNLIGTDCGRCMAVCPYSHPDTAFHSLVRWAIRRSGLARRAALWMDDAFYGRRPVQRPAPAWTRVQF